ncbi:MAG: hypothetical protein P8Z72_00780 [Gammaproteobacteria bacterium]|jgi:hypothetical protein
MQKANSFIFLLLMYLSACSAIQSPSLPTVNKKTRLDCEQQAEIAQARYLARVKTPMYTSSFSTTWAGGARSDTGTWLFNKVLQTCVRHAQHAGQK